MNTINTLATWFLVFVTYSVCGWCMEVVHSIVTQRKFTNRGFLIGPVCPIYGFGAIIMTLILGRTTNVLEIFLVAIGASAILEYITSYLMEKIFHVRWWDYSESKFNIRGRISLGILLVFGLCGVLVMEFTNPPIFAAYESLSETARLIIAGIALVILLVDLAVSLWLIIGCRVTVGTVHADATDEITANIKAALMDKGKLNRRLAKAFPDMTAKKKTTRKAKGEKVAMNKSNKTAKNQNL